MMRLKRAITLLLFAVYIFATGGAAYAALTCHCLTSESRKSHDRACCRHCAQELSEEGVAFTEPCCDDHHSTDIDLYNTTSARDDDKSLRSVVIDLLPALTAEMQLCLDTPAVWEKIAERRALFDQQPYLRCSGLRAPPVSA